MTQTEYRGISYVSDFLNDNIPRWLWSVIYKLWKKHMCPLDIHLLDECWSIDSHVLVCDACGLEVGISYIGSADDEE